MIGLRNDVQPWPIMAHHGPVSWQGGEGVVLCDFEAMHDVWNVLAELAGQDGATAGIFTGLYLYKDIEKQGKAMKQIPSGKRLYITMERSTIVQWVNPLFLWPFCNSFLLVYQRVSTNQF